VKEIIGRLHFVLKIVTDLPPVQFPYSSNRFEQAEANIISIVPWFVDFLNDPSTSIIANEVAFIGYELILHHTVEKKYNNAKGYFTVAELVGCIIDWSLVKRTELNWFGGIDAHRICFSGFSQTIDLAGNVVDGHFYPTFE